MTAPTRSRLGVVFQIVLLLSIGALAAFIALRLCEQRAANPVPEGKVERIFREWSANPQIAGTLIGFCLLDEKGHTVFASPLAGAALCPASALKTATTGAAVDLLGPDFRFKTKLTATAPLDADGTLSGDLVLVGAGDPTFTSEDLGMLAEAAVAAGLKRVAGRLIVDTSVFPANPVSDHWNWGDIGNGYGAGAYGMNIDHNRLEIRFQPGAKVGDPAQLLEHSALPAGTSVENHVLTGAAGSGDEVVVYSEPYGRTVTLRGTVPAGENSFGVTGAIPDPPFLALELLRAVLDRASVSIADSPGPFPPGARTMLASHLSAPLPEIIDHLHAVSDNLEAQCLFLTIGVRQKHDPADAMREYWEKAGVNFVGLRLLDGNGLARANMIRPLDLAAINSAARRGPHGQRFFESLSTYLDGAMRGKIGGMSGVKTQVGFLRTASGRELTFSIMANGLPTGRFYWKLQEELLTQVAAVE